MMWALQPAVLEITNSGVNIAVAIDIHIFPPEDLGKQGYVEEEFFVSGKANVYDWPASGGPAVIKSSDAPYTTRVLVRRPAIRA